MYKERNDKNACVEVPLAGGAQSVPFSVFLLVVGVVGFLSKRGDGGEQCRFQFQPNVFTVIDSQLRSLFLSLSLSRYFPPSPPLCMYENENETNTTLVVEPTGRQTDSPFPSHHPQPHEDGVAPSSQQAKRNATGHPHHHHHHHTARPASSLGLLIVPAGLGLRLARVHLLLWWVSTSASVVVGAFWVHIHPSIHP